MPSDLFQFFFLPRKLFMPGHPSGSTQNIPTFRFLKRKTDISTRVHLQQDTWQVQGIFKCSWQPGVSKKCTVSEDLLNLKLPKFKKTFLFFARLTDSNTVLQLLIISLNTVSPLRMAEISREPVDLAI